jgi:hypothetical protein
MSTLVTRDQLLLPLIVGGNVVLLVHVICQLIVFPARSGIRVVIQRPGNILQCLSV